MVNLNCILAIFPEWGQKVPPLSLCFQNVLYVAAIQLEKAGLDHWLRHILAVDADGRSGRGPVKIYAQNYLQARLSEVSRQ